MKKKGFIILGIVFLVIILIIISSIIWYQLSLKQPNKDTSQDIQAVVEIKSGTSTKEILSLLKEKGVIKNKFASEIYIALHEVRNLQAGKYLFTGNDTLPIVLETISSGKVMDETVTITFLEGKNMRYIASTIAENTNNTTNSSNSNTSSKQGNEHLTAFEYDTSANNPVTEGTYYRDKDTGCQSTLEIKNSTGNSFDFSIYATYMTQSGYPNFGKL